MPESVNEPLLLSGLQKSIRRGNVQDAMAIGAELFRRNPEALLRRLPIICAEDIGMEWLSETVFACKKARAWCAAGRGEDTLRVIANLLEKLATREKSRSGCWARDIAISARVSHEPDWASKLAAELGSGRTIEACRLAIHGFHADGAGSVLAILEIRAIRGEPGCLEAVEACRWRLEDPLSDVDAEILLSALCHFICGTPTQETRIPAFHGLPWIALDMHVAEGKAALELGARKFGMSAERLGWLEFFEEGMRIHPVHAARERELGPQALEVIYQRDLQTSPHAASREWNEIREEFQGIVAGVAAAHSVPLVPCSRSFPTTSTRA